MERNFRKQNSRESFDSQEVSCILSPWISQFWCTPRGALFLLRDGGANLRQSSVAERKGARARSAPIASMRDEVGHQCPVRPSQLVYPPAVLGRKGTRNPSPLSALSRMRKRCARCDGDAVALERAPWTLVQEWGERVTCLVVTRSKLNGLVSLLYEHYGRSAGVKRSLIWSCV